MQKVATQIGTWRAQRPTPERVNPSHSVGTTKVDPSAQPCRSLSRINLRTRLLEKHSGHGEQRAREEAARGCDEKKVRASRTSTGGDAQARLLAIRAGESDHLELFEGFGRYYRFCLYEAQP